MSESPPTATEESGHIWIDTAGGQVNLTAESIASAFDQGNSAAVNERPRSSNPYRPEAEAEQWQAWNCGWHEENPLYRVAGSKEEE